LPFWRIFFLTIYVCLSALLYTDMMTLSINDLGDLD
jgi:hypothetical protein